MTTQRAVKAKVDDHINAERYRKLWAWMLRGGYFKQSSEVYVSSEHLFLFGPTFDSAVDALPEPESDSRLTA